MGEYSKSRGGEDIRDTRIREKKLEQREENTDRVKEILRKERGEKDRVRGV